MSNRSGVKIKAEREVFDPVSKQKARCAWHPTNLPESSQGDAFVFQDFIQMVLKASGLKSSELNDKPVFTPGHTLPYVSLFVKNTQDNDKPAVIFRLRNFFGNDQGANPSSEDLRDDHPANLGYSRDQWFQQTLNGGSFIAFEGETGPLDSFQKNELPDHLRHVYFFANLLTLYQRFALARLSNKVATQVLNGEDGVWEEIRNELLNFTARGYFTQAMQSDHHHRYYRKWQEVFQISQLYAEVRDEIRDLYEREISEHNKQDAKRDIHLQLILGWGTALSLIIGWNTLEELGLGKLFHPWSEWIRFGIGLVLALGFASWFSIMLYRKGKR